MDEVIKGSPTYLAKTIMTIPMVRDCVHELFLKEISEQCQKLRVKSKENQSVLRVAREKHKSIDTFKMLDILQEMKERAPGILDVFVTIAMTKVKEDGSQVAPLCVAYGILMNSRSRELSLIQKLTSVTLGFGGATKKVGNIALVYNNYVSKVNYCIQNLRSYKRDGPLEK
jgi:hypothetical protein